MLATGIGRRLGAAIRDGAARAVAAGKLSLPGGHRASLLRNVALLGGVSRRSTPRAVLISPGSPTTARTAHCVGRRATKTTREARRTAGGISKEAVRTTEDMAKGFGRTARTLRRDAKQAKRQLTREAKLAQQALQRELKLAGSQAKLQVHDAQHAIENALS
jgi:hypothetical protein